MLQAIKQMRHHHTFKRALAEGEHLPLLGIWSDLFPNMPALRTAEQAEIAMHMARTGAESLRLEKRLYSHAWLFERGYPSKLPDGLRPKVQRNGQPIIFPAVGIAVGASSKDPDRREEAKYVEKIMSDAVADMYASGITDPEKIAARMWEARSAYIQRRLKAMI